MDLAEIQSFIEANKEDANVKKFIETLNPVSMERVKGYLEQNEEGKKYLNSFADARVTAGVETFKKNSLPKLIDEEIGKRFPAVTEEQKKMKELEQKLQDLHRESTLKDRKTSALQHFTKEGLTEFTELLI